MLEYTPVHIAYNRPFYQNAEIVKGADVSADTSDDVLEVKFRVDLSHLLFLNLFLNSIMLIILMRK